MSGSEAIKSAKGAGDEWCTPIPLWLEIRDRYFPDVVDVLDPCPSKKRLLPKTVSKTYDGYVDGLEHPWDTFNFVNPPFSDIETWIKLARSKTHLNGKTVFLLPVRSDQPWWYEYARMGYIVFIRGRVNYALPDGGKTKGASFPSCLVIFNGSYGSEYWWPECHKNRKIGK